MPWVYSKSGRGYDEHWHRWTVKKTMRTAKGLELLERCRGCGQLRSTLITHDGDREFVRAERKDIPINLSQEKSA